MNARMYISVYSCKLEVSVHSRILLAPENKTKKKNTTSTRDNAVSGSWYDDRD